MHREEGVTGAGERTNPDFRRELCEAGRVAVSRNAWDEVKSVPLPQTREVNEAEVNSFDVSNRRPRKNAIGSIDDHLGLLVDQEEAW